MRCFYCGVEMQPKSPLPHADRDNELTIDHIYPRALVRQLTVQQKKLLPDGFGKLNTVSCCGRENRYKGQLHPVDWLVIMESGQRAARLAERMISMGENMEEVFGALRRRKK